jgi:hypothetical protein
MFESAPLLFEREKFMTKALKESNCLSAVPARVLLS